MDDLDPELLELARSARTVTVLSGAGMSAESGVPTFRDAGTGLWARWSPEELATRVRWLGARHEVVPGTGHYCHIEDPDATMRHIESFVAEVGPWLADGTVRPTVDRVLPLERAAEAAT